MRVAANCSSGVEKVLDFPIPWISDDKEKFIHYFPHFISYVYHSLCNMHMRDVQKRKHPHRSNANSHRHSAPSHTQLRTYARIVIHIDIQVLIRGSILYYNNIIHSSRLRAHTHDKISDGTDLRCSDKYYNHLVSSKGPVLEVWHAVSRPSIRLPRIHVCMHFAACSNFSLINTHTFSLINAYTFIRKHWHPCTDCVYSCNSF